MFLDADFMTNVTKLRRVSHRRVLLFISNCEGILGYGRGLGVDYESAYKDSLVQCKKNLIIMNKDDLFTWPSSIKVRFNDVRLTVHGTRGGSYWGCPNIWMMLYLTGIYHCSFSVVARKPSPYALVYAFFMCMIRNKTLQQHLEISGEKRYQYNIARSSRSQSGGMI